MIFSNAKEIAMEMVFKISCFDCRCDFKLGINDFCEAMKEGCLHQKITLSLRVFTGPLLLLIPCLYGFDLFIILRIFNYFNNIF